MKPAKQLMDAYFEWEQEGRVGDHPLTTFTPDRRRREEPRAVLQDFGLIWWLHMTRGRRILNHDQEEALVTALISALTGILGITGRGREMPETVCIKIPRRGRKVIHDVEGKLHQLLCVAPLIGKYDPERSATGFKTFVSYKLWSLQDREDARQVKTISLSGDRSGNGGLHPSFIPGKLRHNPEYQALRMEVARTVLTAFTGLGKQDRLSFTLSFCRGYQPKYTGEDFYEKIALSLGSNSGAIKTSTYRANQCIMGKLAGAFEVVPSRRIGNMLKEYCTAHLFVYNPKLAGKVLSKADLEVFRAFSDLEPLSVIKRVGNYSSRHEATEAVDRITLQLIEAMLEMV